VRVSLAERGLFAQEQDRIESFLAPDLESSSTSNNDSVVDVSLFVLLLQIQIRLLAAVGAGTRSSILAPILVPSRHSSK
jgi:hypothetical protein